MLFDQQQASVLRFCDLCSKHYQLYAYVNVIKVANAIDNDFSECVYTFKSSLLDVKNEDIKNEMQIILITALSQISRANTSKMI